MFDRLAEQDAPAGRQRTQAQLLRRCKQSISRDLEALLNTRLAMPAHVLKPYPAVIGSVINYGLIDFAGMCLSSDTDQQQICTAVRLAIERHEPRLHKVEVALRMTTPCINRVEFEITAELKGPAAGDPLTFDAVFRPSLQQYVIANIS